MILPIKKQAKDGESFDIHRKIKQNIKNGGVNYSYLKISEPHQKDKGFEFIINMSAFQVEFVIYRRIGDYFVLVDFFKDYASACDEAREIIDSTPGIKSSIAMWVKSFLNNNINCH